MNGPHAFALLDVVIGGTVVAAFSSIMLVQLGMAQNLSMVANRDLAASRLVSAGLESARALGALAACQTAPVDNDPVGVVVERGGRPYRVVTDTSPVITETYTSGSGTFQIQYCEILLTVTFTAGKDPRQVKAATRLYL
jgi:hypothetical protein